MSIKAAGWAFVWALLLSSGVLVVGATIVERNIQSIHFAWQEFEQSRSEKERTVNALRANLGYGGMIHRLKNAIIRSDPKLIRSVQQKLGAASVAIERFVTIGATTAESEALAGIRQVLDAYDATTENVLRLISQGTTPEAIDREVWTDDSPALDGLAKLDQLLHDEAQQRYGGTSKAQVVSRLRRELGYGGMIHHFKNYVLRRDEVLLTTARASLIAAMAALDQYAALGTNDAEAVAVARIRGVLDGYARALETAPQLSSLGSDARLIDHAVRVDDRPAFDGLATLNREISAEIGRQSQSVHRALDSVGTSATVAIWMAFGVGLGLVVSFVWMLRARITGPISRLTEAMGRLAGNDLTIRIPDTGRGDEIGEMAQAVEVFKQNAFRRDRAEAGLRESEARFAGILDIASQAVISADRAGHILLFNKEAENTFGHSADEVVGRPLEMLLPERFRATHGRLVEEFATGLDVVLRMDERQELVGLRRDGTEFPVEAAISKLEQGGEMTFTVIIQDITQRKLGEKAMVEAKEQAEAANTAKSDFLANMSHEVRTPMNGVIGMTGLLLSTDLDEEQRKFAETVRDSANALLTVLNDILDLSKLEAGKIELEDTDFNFDQTVDQVISLLDARARDKGIEISTEISPDIPRWIRADSGRLRQILFNLVGNAIKFTEKGSVRIFGSHRMIDDQAIELRCEVADTGAGITAEAQRRLFTRFSQADNSTSRKYGGTGLGLAISKELAMLMGGEMGLDSTPGRGSTFWFTIRCEPGEAVEAAEPVAPVPRDDASPLRILLAEDNHVNQKVATAMLVAGGHSVDVAANGLEAIEAVNTRPYDLVLMDIHMPEMDGIQATKRIRDDGGKRASIPIIALTANAMKGDREKYLAAGMNGYVSKPIDATELRDAIARLSGVVAGTTTAPAKMGPRPSTSGEAQEALAEFVATLDDVTEASG